MSVGSLGLSQAPSYLRMHDSVERLWGPMECQLDNWLWKSLCIFVSALVFSFWVSPSVQAGEWGGVYSHTHI